MEKVSFGRHMIGKPTPGKIRWRIKVGSIIAGAVITYLQTATYLPEILVQVVTGLCGMFITIANGIENMFGVDIPNIVPKENVVVVDEDKQE